MPENAQRDRRALRLRRFLERVDVRLVLSGAIIVSLLPFEEVHVLDPLFFIIFGLEFGIRVLLLSRGVWEDVRGDDDERRRAPVGIWLLLFLDLLALISFLPLEDIAATRWLRIFRLTRMVLLVGYWAPLVRDVWSVLLRRERARQVVLMGFVVLTLSFTGAVILDYLIDNQAVTDFDGDGEISSSDKGFFVHLWWAFRQIQDPGNMVASPSSMVALAISVALTVFGLFLVSFLIGLGTDVVRELMQISRLRPPGMHGHSVVVNITPSTQTLLHELMRYHRKLLPTGTLSLSWFRQLVVNANQRIRGPKYVVVGRAHEPPDFLREPELARIVYRQGDPDDDTFLERADVQHAQRVVLLADLASPDPDADTIHAMLTLTERMSARDDIRGPLYATRRTRLLIAEIIDESNVPAAHAAIAAGGDETRSFVVPTERLLALYMFCVARDPDVGELLENLLTSKGHELYTCFFDMPGLGYKTRTPPPLPATAAEKMEHLRTLGLQRGEERRVLPIGLLLSQPSAPGLPDIRVSIHPEDGVEGPSEERCRGFIALAHNFEVVRGFAEELHDPPSRQGPAIPEVAVPPLERTTRPSLQRVMLAGFRSASVSLVESLLMAEPEVQVLILVRDEKARAEAFDHFDAHTNLVRSGLMKGHHGTYRRCGGDSLAFLPEGARPDEEAIDVRVRIATGDQTSSRQLTNLPFGFEHVAKLDVMMLISEEEKGADARTVKTLMKTEALMAASNLLAEQRIVAEVLDLDLAERLRGRYGKLGNSRVSVFSIQELRSVFMFQSVVVPSFDLVYQELLCPWGQSFVRLRAPEEPTGDGHMTFGELAASLVPRGFVLLAVEVADGQGRELLVTGDGDPALDGRIPLKRLRGVWAVGRDEGPSNVRTSTSPTARQLELA